MEKLNTLIKDVNTMIKTVHNLEQEVKELKTKNNIEVNGDININCQVNIIAFGKEDLSYLTIDQIKTILKQGLKGPEKYVEMIHCNKDKLEYKNIYISNRKNKDNSIMLYDGTGWKLCESSCIDRLRDKGIEFMEEKYEEIKDQLPPNIKK
jgi:FtsZ-binding cell division protein ZapB